MRRPLIHGVVLTGLAAGLPSCAAANEEEVLVVTVSSAECYAAEPAEGIRVIAQAPDGSLHEGVTDVLGEARFPELTEGARAVTIVEPGGALRSVVGVESERAVTFGIASRRERVTVTGTAAGMSDETNDLLVFTTATNGCLANFHGGVGPAFSFELPVDTPAEIVAFESKYQLSASGRGYTHVIYRVFWGAIEALSSDTVRDFAFVDTGFPNTVTGAFRFDSLGESGPLVGTDGFGFINVFGKHGIITGIANAIDINAGGDAFEYTVGYFDEAVLDTTFTQYGVQSTGWSGTVTMAWEPGAPRTGTHTPAFLPLPALAGSDATAATLADGLLLEPYSTGATVTLSMTPPFTSTSWSIALEDGSTTLELPALPADFDDLRAAIADAESFGATLQVMRFDNPGADAPSALSSVPIVVSYE